MKLSNIEVRKISTLVDGSISIQIVTQELSPEAMTEIFNMKKSGFSAEWVELEQRQGKTPSERLRAVIFLLWKYRDEWYKDFNLYYHYVMNEIIEAEKKLLPWIDDVEL